jgi:uncharacterized membrane protein
MIDSRLLFLFGCIPVRFLLAYTPLLLNKNLLPYLGVCLSIMSLGFLFLFFQNLRLNAPEANGNTWWANFRLVHGALLMCAAIYCFRSDSIAWVPLTMDVLFGILLFIYHHFY